MSADLSADFFGLHRPGNPLILPNAWDYASGAALAAAGFAAIGTTSLGVAAGAGKPDAKGATRAETMNLARRLSDLPCPVTVDIEGGFGGDAEQIAHLAEELAALGIAGINLEDGRPGGMLAPSAVQSAAIRTIKKRVPGLFVNARTDPFWLGVPDPLDEAVARSKIYADAGADGVFVPSVSEPSDISALVAAAGLPLNVLFLPGRHTVAELATLGVARVSTGSLLFRAALGEAVRTAAAVRDSAPIPSKPPAYAEVVELIARGGASDLRHSPGP